MRYRKTKATPAGLPRSRSRFTRRDRPLWFLNPENSRRQGYSEARENYHNALCLPLLRVAFPQWLSDMISVQPIPERVCQLLFMSTVQDRQEITNKLESDLIEKGPSNELSDC